MEGVYMRVEYIDKNGYLLETSEAVYVFDYVDGRLPSHYLRQDKPLLFFVSCRDENHYSEGIYSYRKTVILSYDVDVTPYSKVFKVRPDDVVHLGFAKVYVVNNPKQGVCYVIKENGRTYLFTGNMNLRFKDNAADEHTAYQKELFLNTMNELRKHGPYDLAIFDVSDEASVGHFLKYCEPRHVFPIGKLNNQLVDKDVLIYQPKYSNYIFEVKNV